MMGTLDAAYEVLLHAGGALHYTEITDGMLEQGLWDTESEDPYRSVCNTLSRDIREKGEDSKFCHYEEGTGYYCLKNIQDPVNTPLTLVDAAEYVLEHYSGNKPMHYVEIAELAADKNLVQSEALDPGRTMHSAISQEIRRKTAQCLVARFEMYGDGLIGLRRWHVESLTRKIEDHNQKVRDQLRTRIEKMDPKYFEKFIGLNLLPALGIVDVALTPYTCDSGIDIRGTLVVEDVLRTQIGVQVKHWNGNNIQRPDIQRLRGALGDNEQGLFITNSDFSARAREEAENQNKMPITLINGEQLLSLLIDHEILTKKISRTIIDLA